MATAKSCWEGKCRPPILRPKIPILRANQDRWLKLNPEKRDKLFLATKFGIQTDATTGVRRIRNEPEYIQQACENSLQRLGVEYIDLYYCHRIQSSQPIEVTAQEMKKLRDAGRIKHLGLSECSAETLRRACKVRKPWICIYVYDADGARCLGGTH